MHSKTAKEPKANADTNLQGVIVSALRSLGFLLVLGSVASFGDSLGFDPSHRNYQVQISDPFSSDVVVQGVALMQGQFPQFGVVSSLGLVGYLSLSNPGTLIIWTTRVTTSMDEFMLDSLNGAPPSPTLPTFVTFPPFDNNNNTGGNNGGTGPNGGTGDPDPETPLVQTPEPATLAMLTLAGGAMLLLRKVRQNRRLDGSNKR